MTKKTATSGEKETSTVQQRGGLARARKLTARERSGIAQKAARDPVEKAKRRVSIVTGKQRRFVDSYLVSLNATRAAIAAGYSRKTAAAIGSKLLKSPAIRKVVDVAAKERAAQAQIEQEAVLRELRIVFNSSVDDFEIGDDGRPRVRPGVPAEAIKAVSSVRWTREYDFDGKLRTENVKISLWDKPKALSLAMRYLGMLRDTLVLDVGSEAKKMIDRAADDFDALIAQRLKHASTRTNGETKNQAKEKEA